MKKLLFSLLLAFFASAFAQLSYRGEVALALDGTLSEAFPAQVGWTLAAHLEASYQFTPLLFTLVLDPSLRFSEEISFEPGLTEAYGFSRQGDFDLSFGIERLPLEFGRLSVPYSVEAVGERGVRRGVPGARVAYYSGDWRLRGALFYHHPAERLTPLVSVRRSFGAFELEAQALYPGEFVLGLGGSGLVGELVFYGEAWLLTNPLEPRGTLGLTGNLAGGSWTLEAAYLAPGEASLKDDPDAELALQPEASEPRPALLGQLALQLGEQGDRGLNLTGNLFFDPDALRARTMASYTLIEGDHELNLALTGRFGPEPAILSFILSLKHFF